MNLIAKIAVIITIVSGALGIAKVFIERALLPSVQFDITCRKIGWLMDRWVLKVDIHLSNVGSSTLVVRNLRLAIRYILDSDFKADDKETETLFKSHLFRQTLKEGDLQKVGRLYFPHSLTGEMQIDPSSLKRRANSTPQSASTEPAKEKGFFTWIKLILHDFIDKLGIRTRSDRQAGNAAMDSESGRKDRGFLVLENDTFVQPGVNQHYGFTTTVPDNTLCALTWSSFEYARSLSPWQHLLLVAMKRLYLIQHTLTRAKKPHTAENACWVAADAGGNSQNQMATARKSAEDS